ncbi:MAG: PrsW family glutamic-type intramembrane protease [Anaerolineae bacterium]
MTEPFSPLPASPEAAIPAQTPSPIRGVWSLRLGFAGGVGLALLGSLVGSLYIALNVGELEFESEKTFTTTFGFAIIYLGLGLGIPLAVTARRGLRRRPSPPFALPIWIIAGVIILAWLIGQTVLLFDLAPTALFPPLHALSATFPPLFLVGSVALALRSNADYVTQRQAIAGIAFGAIIVVSIALVLEISGAAVLIAAGVLFVVRQPGGLARLEAILEQARTGALALDEINPASLLQNPGVVLIAFIGIAIVVPLIEETAKGLLIPLFNRWYRLTPARGWSWGLMAGAGFAIAESLFNGAVDLNFWIIIAIMRAGTSVLHCTTAGLTGLGWAQSLHRRNFWPLVRNYGIAVATHAVWNGLAMTIVVASLRVAGSGPMAIGAVIVSALALTGLILVGLATLGVLVATTYYLRRQQ